MKDIYLFFSQTGTLFSRALKYYTKAPYNHVSISLGGDLTKMYSFGRKSTYNMLNNGFVIESINRGVYKHFKNVHCCLVKITVEDYEYEEIKSAIRIFVDNKDKYGYNLIGLIGVIFNKKIQMENKFFCSQFVAYILNNTKIWDKCPEFTKPMDLLENIERKDVIFEGLLQCYQAIN